MKCSQVICNKLAELLSKTRQPSSPTEGQGCWRDPYPRTGDSGRFLRGLCDSGKQRHSGLNMKRPFLGRNTWSSGPAVWGGQEAFRRWNLAGGNTSLGVGRI